MQMTFDKMNIEQIAHTGISLICSGEGELPTTLRQQLKDASMKLKSYTPAGIYYNICNNDPAFSLRGVPERYRVDDLLAEVNYNNSEFNFGFILWLSDGIADLLEIYFMPQIPFDSAENVKKILFDEVSYYYYQFSNRERVDIGHRIFCT